MKIAICDDDSIIRLITSKSLLQYSEKYDCKIEVKTFSSGEELLESPIAFDIILLDIIMEGIDGIETAYRLKERDNNAKVILLTSCQERFKDGFKIQAYRFMTKPLALEELEEYMNDARKDILLDKELVFRKDGIKIKLSMRKILYLSAQSGYTEVWTDTDMYRSKKSLSSWEEMLDLRLFYRCHKKFIVNLSHIEKIGSYVVMKNGERIQSSRRKSVDLKRRFNDFDLSL